MRAFVAARSRYSEDQLARAVERGTRQFVILGDGLDTFGYRNPYEDLRVFEVDHPATQAWKRRRLQAARIFIPNSLVFVPVDFRKQNLVEQLRSTGFKTEAAAFFSWLGVTQYLAQKTVLATLKLIASPVPGKWCRFRLRGSTGFPRFAQSGRLDALAGRVRGAGEPFEGFFSPGELTQELEDMGFRHIEVLDAERLTPSTSARGYVSVVNSPASCVRAAERAPGFRRRPPF
jgi:methyltransferase (TIGR00027 family)